MYAYEYICKVCELPMTVRDYSDPFSISGEICCGGIRHGGHYCGECCPNHKNEEVEAA